jgi:hypothetical protein
MPEGQQYPLGGNFSNHCKVTKDARKHRFDEASQTMSTVYIKKTSNVNDPDDAFAVADEYGPRFRIATTGVAVLRIVIWSSHQLCCDLRIAV